NNKYLAVGLSIAAVGILVYQIFFNEGGSSNRRPSTLRPETGTQLPGLNPSAQSPAVDPALQAPTGPVQTPGEGAGLVVDYHSEILLKPVPKEFTQPVPRKELPSLFRPGIFSFEAPEEETIEEKINTRTKTVEFKLNAIIMDKDRKLTIINDTILKVGDMIAGARVMRIGKGEVILNVNNKNIILSTNSRIKQVKIIEGGESDDGEESDG
ncbi:MAG: hypothetical protein GY940_01055, partial [bacterium]|nr:hypothetical protein [bacterium]